MAFNCLGWLIKMKITLETTIWKNDIFKMLFQIFEFNFSIFNFRPMIAHIFNLAQRSKTVIVENDFYFDVSLWSDSTWGCIHPSSKYYGNDMKIRILFYYNLLL